MQCDDEDQLEMPENAPLKEMSSSRKKQEHDYLESLVMVFLSSSHRSKALAIR